MTFFRNHGIVLELAEKQLFSVHVQNNGINQQKGAGFPSCFRLHEKQDLEQKYRIRRYAYAVHCGKHFRSAGNL